MSLVANAKRVPDGIRDAFRVYKPTNAQRPCGFDLGFHRGLRVFGF